MPLDLGKEKTAHVDTEHYKALSYDSGFHSDTTHGPQEMHRGWGLLETQSCCFQNEPEWRQTPFQMLYVQTKTKMQRLNETCLITKNLWNTNN